MRGKIMWDFDKLFADGNIIGIKNCHENKIYNHSIKKDNDVFDVYKNEDLSLKNQLVETDDNGVLISTELSYSYRTDFEIQYIIRLDEHGNVDEILFNRERDMPKPMPKLETGMFVKIYNMHRCESFLGFIYDNRVIYQNGDWDEIYDLKEDRVMEIYSAEALCFNSCCELYLLWSNPKYQSN